MFFSAKPLWKNLFHCQNIWSGRPVLTFGKRPKLNTLENTDTETISASVFVFIDSLVVSASQGASSYATSRQNDLEFHLGCHTCWLSCFTLVCLWCGRTVGRSVYGHVINKFSPMGSLPHFLTHGASRERAPLTSNEIHDLVEAPFQVQIKARLLS